MKENRKILFHDTTLRDGEQTSGVSFSRENRMLIAKKLDEIGIDFIELGFAASSEKQCDDIRQITKVGLKAKTMSLARPLKSDIDAALRSGVDGVILVIGFSDIHLKYKFKKKYSEVLNIMSKGIKYAKNNGLYVQISAEDATRTPNERLAELASLGDKLGADRICISDTLGLGTPELITSEVKSIRSACNMPISAHCHNDFGLAVANSIAAVTAGAEFLAVTVNGIGERCGNASFEQCVMALTQIYDYDTNINLKKIKEVSKLVSDVTNIQLEPTRPIVGKNCFRHESGIHVNGILKNPQCYEPYNPELIGSKSEIVIGKTNGISAIKYFAMKLGVKLDDSDCTVILEQVQKKADENEMTINDLKEMLKQCKTR